MKMVLETRWVLIAAMVLGLSLGKDSSVLAMTTVRVWEQAKVGSKMIRLGDISTIEGEDQLLVKKLKSIVLTRAPSPGEMREISAHYIEAKVRHNGINTSEVRLDIPKKIQVVIKTVEVSSQKIEKIVGQFIFEKMPWDPKQVSIKFSGTKDISLTAGKVTYEVVPRKKEDYLGNSNLLVVFMVGGREEKRIWVTAHIDVNQEVVVSTHPLKRHYIITKEDICLKKMNLKGLPKDVITNPFEVIGKRTRRTVDPDVPLRLNCLEVPPLVRRGDMVTIIVETEVLKITTQGVVTEDGGKGEMVRVINTGSRREVFARVINSRTVEIEL